MTTKCKVCGYPTDSLLELNNSVKTQAVCKTVEEALQVPMVEMKVRYCRHCDFFQIDTVDFAHYSDEEYFLTTEISETQRIYQQWFFEHVERYLASPVAEIGPGDGFLGKLLASRYEYVGYEPARKSFDECTRKNLTVINGYFSGSDKKYAAIIGRQVLEHIEDLQKFLQDVLSSLTENGVAIFEVPNIDKARNDNRIVDFCPEHINYFTLSSLGLLFAANGFALQDISKTYNDEYLLIVASRRPHFSRISATFDFSSMVFWGAGSRGISLCHAIGATPRYFVDTDSNKFGKYIPSTAIEIKSPAFLYGDASCEAVVITSFFYFDEVLKGLRTHGFKGKIYRLDERSQPVLCET